MVKYAVMINKMNQCLNPILDCDPPERALDTLREIASTNLSEAVSMMTHLFVNTADAIKKNPGLCPASYRYFEEPIGNAYQSVRYLLEKGICIVEFTDPMMYMTTKYAKTHAINCSYDENDGLFKIDPEGGKYKMIVLNDYTSTVQGMLLLELVHLDKLLSK